jgi:hypothetical protein
MGLGLEGIRNGQKKTRRSGSGLFAFCENLKD